MNIVPALIAGWLAGYIVNYFADVLPEERRLGRPACKRCAEPFQWSDYLLLRGCRSCKNHRPWRAYIVQIVALIAAGYIALAPPPKLGFALGLITITYFGVVTVIDLEHRLIMHVTSAAGAILGLVAGIFSHGLAPTLIGGAVGAAVMFSLYLLGMLFARYRAKRLGIQDDEEALGFGDVTLGGVLGLYLGWPLICLGLLIGILAGGLISLLMILGLAATRRYQTLNVFTAYGPFLIFGTLLLIYFPQLISHFLPK
jgi:leader peptidase (prepilin peptidase)/N-methyltransferase